MPDKAEYRMELYKRWQDDPVNPQLNEWWTELNPVAQDSISELFRRGKVFEQEEIQAVELKDEKQSMVDEILHQTNVNADLFTVKIPRQLDIDAPDDIGLIKYNQDGSRDVINDSVTSTLCDTIEWKTINDSIDHYRVTYELHGKTFTMKHKSRPIGTEKRMTVSVTPYG